MNENIRYSNTLNMMRYLEASQNLTPLKVTDFVDCPRALLRAADHEAYDKPYDFDRD